MGSKLIRDMNKNRGDGKSPTRRMTEKMVQEKLYHCCNTCRHKDDSFYGCKKAGECYNGFSAYEPNEEMIKQETDDL